MESLCQNCCQNYNQQERQTVILPCGDSVCLACFNSLLQPQDNKITCPDKDCGESQKISQKFKDRILKMRQVESGIWIMCDVHPQSQASIFCKQHQTLICDRCALMNHSNHKSEILEVKHEDINKYCDKALGYLIRLRDNINNVFQTLQQYTQRDKAFSSQQFMALVTEIQETLLTPHLKHEQDISFLDLQLRSQPQIVAEIPQQLLVEEDYSLDFDEYSQKMFNISLDQQKLLKQWIGKNIKFELIFRGTRDGFKSQKFYQLCSSKAPTMTIIKSQYGEVFGGYISISHQYSVTEVKNADKDAFIFSLSKKQKFEQTGKNSNYAVRFEKGYFLEMGYGPAIFLKDNCNNFQPNSGSFFTSEITSNTFKWPEDVEIGSEQGKKYLGGSEKFKVLEVETYQIVNL